MGHAFEHRTLGEDASRQERDTKTSKSNLQQTLMTDGGKKKAPATTAKAYF